MRAIWSGSIGFGLVNIPVKLFSATQDSTIDLDMLDKHDHANIRYARINQDTGKEVAWGDIVKGYKYNDEYVVLSDEDFEKVRPEKNKTIGIDQFVQQEKIDLAYYDTPYYLEPSKGGERAYVLLREALKKSGKVAIGSYVLRTKENLCLLKAEGDVIMLMKIRFPEEIRSYGELNIPKTASVKDAELKMAISLIDQLTPKSFSMDKYKDTYDEELMKIIEMKAKGKRIPKPKFKIVKNTSKDLMEQLKASLGDNTTTKRRKAS
ncbi:MAG: Ku protein [Flavipsychrobacter sp.]